MLMITGERRVPSGNGLLTTIAWGLGGKVDYALEGSVFTAGAAIQWLRDELGLLAKASDSEAMARSVPDTNGCFVVPAFTGLGAGVYTLIEEQVPNGYNKAADLEFTISNSDYTTTNLEQTAPVINNEGVELPSTGGIGTKIFIAVGAVLVVVAAVVIVTNQRAKKEEI